MNEQEQLGFGEETEPLNTELPPVEITEGQESLMMFDEPEQVKLFDLAPTWRDHWVGMPEYDHGNQKPWSSITVHFACRQDRADFAEMIEQTITDKTKSVWVPRADIGHRVHLAYKARKAKPPHYPIYIISKGRWEKRLTAKALERIGVDYHIVIEPQEYDNYAAVIDPRKILVLPFSNLGQGSIPARNFVWDHATKTGAKRHWILDDNIASFHRFQNNMLHSVQDGTIFRAAEEFTDRYENVGISGFNYFMFVSRKEPNIPPYYLNTRVYSCILIQNDLTEPDGTPLRWRGRYNEDTDLCLRYLKAGGCTFLFNAFLAYKMPTMTMTGGNTEELYEIEDGRLKMAESLVEQHPDVARITWKWGRWQHHVDYSPFKRNKLRLRSDAEIPEYEPDWGMTLEVNPGYEAEAAERGVYDAEQG